jgi:hypothetical protein
MDFFLAQNAVSGHINAVEKESPHQPVAKPMGEKGFEGILRPQNIKKQPCFSMVPLLSQLCGFWGGGKLNSLFLRRI